MLRANLRRFHAWALESEGSTRPLAIIRIGLALILWARFGSDVAFFHHPNLPRIALILAFTPAVTLMLVGCWSRSMALLSGCIVMAMRLYSLMHPATTTWQSHHIFILAMLTLLCGLGPCGGSYSVDRFLELRRCRRLGLPAPRERGNLRAQRLMALQISALYFWAAFAKTHAGYFTGANIEALFMREYGLGQYPDWIPGFHAICVGTAWGTLFTEYLLVWALFVPRVRPFAIVIGVIFHGIIYLTLEVLTYSVTMMLSYLAFLDPDRVHRWIDDIQDPPEAVAKTAAGD